MRCILAAVAVVMGARAALGAQPVVLVAPFAPLGDAARSAWVGQAVQQCIVNDLLRSRTVSAAALAVPAGQIVDNAAAAVLLARQQGAQTVIWGTFHINGQELRITGQLNDVRDGRPVGAVKATGPMRDLFALEDSVAGQAKRIVMELSGSKPVNVDVVIPAAIQQMAGVPGAFAVRPAGPLRDEAMALADLERELRRRAWDRDWDISYRRYGLLWGPVYYYYPVTSYVPFVTCGRSYRAYGPTVRFNGAYFGGNTFIRFGGGM